MDLRAHTLAHPALCIDTRYASFLDDAFSLLPETGELLVHVAAAVRAQVLRSLCAAVIVPYLLLQAGKLRRHPSLQQVAKERLSSAFLSSGPLHMLTPAALSALALSAEPDAANQVITVALTVVPGTGEFTVGTLQY